MKKYSAIQIGRVPDAIKSFSYEFDGREADQYNYEILEDEIEMRVVDFSEAYGNINKDGSGWLSDRETGGRVWRVEFEVK